MQKMNALAQYELDCDRITRMLIALAANCRYHSEQVRGDGMYDDNIEVHGVASCHQPPGSVIMVPLIVVVVVVVVVVVDDTD